MFSDAEKTDIRRFCGYPVFGNASSGGLGWRFYQAYGLLEYRMLHLTHAEEAAATWRTTGFSRRQRSIACGQRG